MSKGWIIFRDKGGERYFFQIIDRYGYQVWTVDQDAAYLFSSKESAFDFWENDLNRAGSVSSYMEACIDLVWFIFQDQQGKLYYYTGGLSKIYHKPAQPEHHWSRRVWTAHRAQALMFTSKEEALDFRDKILNKTGELISFAQRNP